MKYEKRVINAEKRRLARKAKAPVKAPRLLPKVLKGSGGLSRRIVRRREMLGLVGLDDHMRCLMKNFWVVAHMHAAHETGFREGHLVGYDSGYASGQAVPSAPVE